MEQPIAMRVLRKKLKKAISSSIYSNCLISRHISVPIVEIGKNIAEVIKSYIVQQFEGKCIVEGYIKPTSTKIINYSSGIVKSTYIIFEVVFECQTCFPVEGMTIECVAKNITKAGIRGESKDHKPSPIVVFIARDHHYSMPYFSSIKENDTFTAKVIGQRFELNDKFVSVIAELVDTRRNSASPSEEWLTLTPGHVYNPFNENDPLNADSLKPVIRYEKKE